MEIENDIVRGTTEFKIFTGLLKAAKTPDGKMRLAGVASSTTRDLHGDRMLASAINDMERAANNNLTIFLNHSYNVPEDVGGSVQKAWSVTRGVDDNGDPNIDLHFDVLINDANDRAVQTWAAIDRGTKLGLSIGAMIPDGGAKRNKDGSYLIEHVDLLETSIVGIPANPRSWVEYAVKAIKSKDNKDRVIPVGSPTLTLTDNDYTITGSLDDATFTFNNVEVDPIVVDEVEPEETASAVEPDITDTQVTIIQIDTGDNAADDDVPAPSQEALPSAPEAEDGLLDETADGDDEAIGDDVTRAIEPTGLDHTLSETLALLRDTTRELIDAKQAALTAEVAKAAMEVERNQARLERDHVMRATKDILDRVANAPLARKTILRDAQADLSERFAGVYSESFLSMLKGNEANE